ncbi:hypothetical protein FJTKL_06047 [Diaporthe vaccinii]|uniref:Uncharacterized protein n=1 Tax=Diaporthe vaccinii TaxID=105482 RepID=A0ABR4EX76_9PEZI
MDNYDISDPYGRRTEYYFDEHVCLWQVTEAEIVGHFRWDDLEQNDNWYQEIIIPAFRGFRGQHTVSPTEGAIDNLLLDFNKLSVGHDDSDSSDTGYAERSQCYYSDGEEDADSVGEFQCVYTDEDYYWDTNDDLEEANAADDIINIIEGYWR